MNYFRIHMHNFPILHRPQHLKERFIIPSDKLPSEVTPEDIVRIYVSCDIGWSKRGNGKQYDSLNGHAAIMGYFSGKVLDLTTLNWACKACESKIPLDAHDCRKNFEGTAKAMEAEAAKILILYSQILKKFNVQVGIFAADNDSSSICAIRKEATYYIVKVDDLNHTKKGVANYLYQINGNEDPLKELKKDAKDYLRRCFAYAVSQNIGDIEKLKQTLQNIPNHEFNIHNDCGEWCKYKDNQENSKSSKSPWFQSPQLFSKLTEMFNKLADNAERYASAASSQANEALNNSITRKAPKNICFSKSDSMDTRAKCATARKNYNFLYLSYILSEQGIKPGQYLKDHTEFTIKRFTKKSEMSKTPAFKMKTIENKRKQSMSRKKKAREENTYQVNITLMDTPEIIQSKNVMDLSIVLTANSQLVKTISTSSDVAFVYMDLETGGFPYTHHILQVAMKCEEKYYDKYINPTREISEKSSEVNGNKCIAGQLYLNNIPISSQPKRIVAGEVLHFLSDSNKPYIFIGHNIYSFDIRRLLFLMKSYNLLGDFCNVVVSCIDTYILFEAKFPERKGRGALKLATLVKDFLPDFSFVNAHAFGDICALEALTAKFYTTDSIFDKYKSLKEIIEKKKSSG